ncbi:MAG: hypothetical protein ABIJ97_13730, partial [Bacteroidota bacterium]
FMFSQGVNWKIDGNNINKPIGKVGSTNNKDVHTQTYKTNQIYKNLIKPTITLIITKINQILFGN